MRKAPIASMIGLLGLGSLTAWAQGPSPSQPEGPRPQASSTPSASVPTAPAPQPSLAREKLSLQDAVQRAVASHPNIAIAQADVARTEALVREARASSLPSLTANGTYTRLDADRELAGRVVAAADQRSANVTLSVPLFAPQRWMQWSHAGDNVAVSRATAADTKRLVAVATARAYLAVVSQHRVVEVNERARETAKAHADFARSLFQGGLGNRIDLVRAEQELAVSEAQIQSAYAGLVRAQEALGVMVAGSGGVDSAEPVALPAQPTDANSALENLTAQRPDVQALQLRVRATERLVRDSWADYMPLLVGTFQPFYQDPPSLVNPKTGWQAQLILQIPLYDGGLRYGQADERRALRADAQARLDSALRQARADVRAAFEALKRADEAFQAARRAADLALESLALANQAYKAGATTNLEVIDAERRARDAETSAVVAEDAARQARLDLLAASGRFP